MGRGVKPAGDGSAAFEEVDDFVREHVVEVARDADDAGQSAELPAVLDDGWVDCLIARDGDFGMVGWLGFDALHGLPPQSLPVGCAASERRRRIDFKMPSNVKQDILN